MSFSTKCQTIKRQTILVFIPQTKISQTEIIRSRLAIYKKNIEFASEIVIFLQKKKTINNTGSLSINSS